MQRIVANFYWEKFFYSGFFVDLYKCLNAVGQLTGCVHLLVRLDVKHLHPGRTQLLFDDGIAAIISFMICLELFFVSSISFPPYHSVMLRPAVNNAFQDAPLQQFQPHFLRLKNPRIHDLEVFSDSRPESHVRNNVLFQVHPGSNLN